MDYPTYLADGWPIASGVIEGACRHLEDRCELSGMRWSQAGAEYVCQPKSDAHDHRKVTHFGCGEAGVIIEKCLDH